MNAPPKLLVEWSSPWQEFVTAIRPALGRSPHRLAGEARSGLFPYRGMLLCWVVEIGSLIALLVVPTKLASMRPYTPPPLPKYDVIYFSADELPRTEDVGGAQTGRSGRAGGQEAHHPTQTIHVARGNGLRETVVDAPQLKLPRSDSAVANLLAYQPVPGAVPAEGLKSSPRAPAVLPVAVPPPPDVAHGRMPAAPALNAGAIPPSPRAPQREMSPLPVPGSHAVEVIPPPVSAAPQVSSLIPRLALPAPSVIVPPPAQPAHPVASLGPGWGAGELRKQVVPPPVQLGNTSAERRTISGWGSAAVVPPPVQLGASSLPPQPVGGLGGGMVVPPPPAISGGSSLPGQGRGNRGSGLGGALDMGAVSAPPAGGGSGGGTGVVVSRQPGSEVGMPDNGRTGSLAMSPSGGNKPGLGGSGGGSGIGRGSGPGSGFSGEGPGAGKEGSGRGSDPTAHGGISPYPGPGGAGSATGGTPAVPGVSVRGGRDGNILTLPSFGSEGNQPGIASPLPRGGDNHGPGITVIASSRSGGAFNFYGLLKGDPVYTIYIETSLPTVMQYTDPNSIAHPNARGLIAPQALRTDLPSGLAHARLVITCVLTPSGLLRNLQVLDPGPAVMTSKVLAALSKWKFRPALRGDQPVEVTAILGFNIDTNDRF